MNLENNGERMDIDYYNMNYNEFDIYQKSHFKRYEYAKTKIKKGDLIGDMACGSGYGSLILSEIGEKVHGIDIDTNTINEINKRYEQENKVNFIQKNLLNLDYNNMFDVIVSFETIEHFFESEIDLLIKNFHKALKPSGTFIFSTPYNQEKNYASMKWHKTFYITEETIKKILEKYFVIEEIWYQDYETHELKKEISKKDFIICQAKKII
jgi:2-polyprenyl-3-methyl-5-hydroxy-6-metoxy-1,4-benzoquinol methylase